MRELTPLNLAVLTGISRKAGGLFFAVNSMCQELNSRLGRVTVLGPDDGYVEEDLAAWGAVGVIPHKACGPLGFSWALRRDLVKINPDLIHLNGIWLDNQWASLLWQKRHGKPVVISPHGMLDPWALKNSAWKKKLVASLFSNKSLHGASCIHALCRSEVESIRAYGLRNPIALIPNGVALPEYSEGERPSDGKNTLLFLGRIHPKKGIAELLAAWSRFSGDWRLLVAGWDDGGHEEGFKAQAVALGITESVEFIGPKYGEEKEQLFRSVDAFILPSFSEGLPMSVLEAWSFQLPVVMTDFCNLPEGFSANAAIRIAPDGESIFQGLEELTSLSDTERKIMGANGRRLVEEKFTWPGIAENMHKVYEWCLTGENPPACMEFFNG